MSEFEFEGIRFHYQIVGKGFPLVLNHGLGGDLTHPREIFDEVPGFQTLYWDCRGHGETDPVGPPEGFSFAQFSQDLNALVSHLGIEGDDRRSISHGSGLVHTVCLGFSEEGSGPSRHSPAWLDKPHPPNLLMCEQAAAVFSSGGGCCAGG